MPKPTMSLPPTMTLDVICQYSEHPRVEPGPRPVVGLEQVQDGTWELTVCVFGHDLQGNERAIRRSLPVLVDHPDSIPTDQEMVRAGQPLWSMLKLAPTAWKLVGLPVPISSTQTVFLTVVNVPDPAPWEQKVVVDAPAVH